MTSQQFDSDDFLLSELKAAYAEADQVPADALNAAKASFTWRSIDAELEALPLCFDSAVDDLALVRADSPLTLRALSFGNDHLGIEVELSAADVTGQLIPAQGGAVRLVSAEGPSDQTTADANGCFVLSRPHHGPFRLEFTTADAQFATEWIAA
jgi:hypothetical protein